MLEESEYPHKEGASDTGFPDGQRVGQEKPSAPRSFRKRGGNHRSCTEVSGAYS